MTPTPRKTRIVSGDHCIAVAESHACGAGSAATSVLLLGHELRPFVLGRIGFQRLRRLAAPGPLRVQGHGGHQATSLVRLGLRSAGGSAARSARLTSASTNRSKAASLRAWSARLRVIAAACSPCTLRSSRRTRLRPQGRPHVGQGRFCSSSVTLTSCTERSHQDASSRIETHQSRLERRQVARASLLYSEGQERS